ncbi:MAG: site-specific integrase [Bryobacterales bacterium]|nr:site-specific integrase [Bryobacterales bacterium]
MSLVLYRRHLKACRVQKSKLPARARRLFLNCECPIWMYGRTDNGLVPRQSTGFTALPEAEALRASLVAQSQTEAVRGHRIDECVLKYLASRRHELSEKTYGHHDLLLSRLTTYCERQGVYFTRELTVDLLETFKIDGLPKLKDTSKSTAVAKLRCFLRDAFRRGWITESLVDRVTAHRAVYEQKEPYSDEEVERILDEALKLTGGTHGYAKHPKTFRLLLELMLETGMRVGDSIRFDPALATQGEHLWIYTYQPQKHKRTEKPRVLEAYISDRLKQAIDACEWLSTKLPFHYGSSKNPAYLANEVYERMKTVGPRCEVADCRPHRLRDTFAVRKLLAGFQLEDVARLLGHSSVKVTEAYYAKWVRSRRLRLERLVAESLVNT